jgi:hypothetical protein
MRFFIDMPLSIIVVEKWRIRRRRLPIERPEDRSGPDRPEAP